MSSGKNSRLSQVLKQFPRINEGNDLPGGDLPSTIKEIENLSLSALSELLRVLVNKNEGVRQAKADLNESHLQNISLRDERMVGEFSFTNGLTEEVRLQQILERLELTLRGAGEISDRGRFGLGSNNLLYIACELLLIAKDEEGMPLLLVEEPEAHLHPQRQLQMLSYLREKADTENLQVILSTHSPVLASKVKVENVILVGRTGAFSLAQTNTKLSSSDYKYLSRFLDATRSNLFFAEHLLIVEGDAEELLLPTVARLMGRDLTKAGVSIVNVRGVGLSRYSRIFIQKEMREEQQAREIGIKVACITDRDIMPDRAPEILGLAIPDGEAKKGSSRRKWRRETDPLFGAKYGEYGIPNAIEKGKQEYITAKQRNDGGTVKTFVSNHWTLEFDLARQGLAKEVFVAARLAIKDTQIHSSDTPEQEREKVVKESEGEFIDLFTPGEEEKIAVLVYKEFIDGASKAIAAQYLGELLEERFGESSDEEIRNLLPDYITSAIEYVTN